MAPCTHQTPSHTTTRLPRETCNTHHAKARFTEHHEMRPRRVIRRDKGQTFHSAGGPSGTLSYSVPEITRDKREIGEKPCHLTPNMMRQGVTYLGKHPTRVVSINCRPFRAFIIHPETHATMTLCKAESVWSKERGPPRHCSPLSLLARGIPSLKRVLCFVSLAHHTGEIGWQATFLVCAFRDDRTVQARIAEFISFSLLSSSSF